jgi:nicotinate-nucleotide adenylyltransferase
MDFHVRAAGSPSRVGVLPGAFHPPTLAHVAMAKAALEVVDEVVFTLPRAFPHKEYTAAGLAERMELLRAAIAGEPRFSLAASEGGLFIELAREAREAYGEVEVFLLCGRDAAERIAGWDYGAGDPIARQLEEYRLLVASRMGRYEPPEDLRPRVVPLAIPAELEAMSSSEVRRRIRAGEEWRHLVPEAVAGLIEARMELWQ